MALALALTPQQAADGLDGRIANLLAAPDTIMNWLKKLPHDAGEMGGGSVKWLQTPVVIINVRHISTSCAACGGVVCAVLQLYVRCVSGRLFVRNVCELCKYLDMHSVHSILLEIVARNASLQVPLPPSPFFEL
jgi:hypothetical protein